MKKLLPFILLLAGFASVAKAGPIGTAHGVDASDIYVNLSVIVASTTLNNITGLLQVDDTITAVKGVNSSTIVVTGASDLQGDVTIGGTLDVTGATMLSSTLSAADTITASKGVTGTTMTLSGAGTFNGDVTLGNASADTNAVYGYTVSYASFTVNQGVTIGSATVMNGNVTAGDAVADTLTVNAYTVHNASITVNQGITVSSASTFSDTITASKGVNAATMTVTGAATFSESTFNGNVTSTGTVTISGAGGLTVTGGPTTVYNRTEAQLKVSTPTAKGQLFYDTTNDEFVKSTGTATCFDYSQIHDKTAVPVGW
ncbi:MAG: hypothetical protein HY548_04645 [Elusimicrobia bacterium]|nr:hypothetical protein [Elusimicrobiota bacterium]